MGYAEHAAHRRWGLGEVGSLHAETWNSEGGHGRKMYVQANSADIGKTAN